MRGLALGLVAVIGLGCAQSGSLFVYEKTKDRTRVELLTVDLAQGKAETKACEGQTCAKGGHMSEEFGGIWGAVGGVLRFLLPGGLTSGASSSESWTD